LIQALEWNGGTWVLMRREKSKWRTHEEESTEAEPMGGITRSSEEVSVMEMERRGYIAPQDRWVNRKGRNP